MENLPLEIAENILCRLPMVFKIQSREVCKTWRTLVPKPKTKRGLLYGVSHLQKKKQEVRFYLSEQNSKKVDDDYLGALTKLEHRITLPYFKGFMVGSCQGLVCYASCSYSILYEERKSYICNPVTAEKIELPIICKCGDDPDAVDAIGFGYNRSNDEYKVVRILRDRTFQVDTLRRGTSWTNKSGKIDENEICFKPLLRDSPSVGVFASGALHWKDKSAIIAFDLKHETFELLPPIPSVVRETNVDLMVLGGKLCVLQVVLSKHFRIWELENRKTVRYTQKRSYWITKFSISWEDWRLLDTVPLPNSNQNFLWYNAILSCYDPETKTLRKLKETLKKLMANGADSIYTNERAIPFMHILDLTKENTKE